MGPGPRKSNGGIRNGERTGLKPAPTMNSHPYPTYKPSSVPWLGNVPKHWAVRRLKTLCSEYGLYGANVPATQYKVSGVRFLRTTDITEDGELRNGGVFLPSNLVSDYLLSNSDLLVSRSGTIGRSFLYSAKQHGPCSYAGYLVRFVANKHIIPKFLFLFTKTAAFDGFLRVMAISSTIDNVNAEKYSNMYLPLPPLPEQRAIAAFLDRETAKIDALVAKKERLIELLEEGRNNFTQKAIQSPGATTHRLGVVADLMERPIKRANEEMYTPIGLYNRGRGIFLKEPERGKHLGDSSFFWVEDGDLVISGQFAWEGAIALASDIEHRCVASHRFPILRGKPHILETGFLFAFLQSGWGQLLLDLNSRGAAGRNRPLNTRALMKEKISLPPLEVQRQIVDMLVHESRVRQKVAKWSKLLQEYRTRLIADVVTGRIDVREEAGCS